MLQSRIVNEVSGNYLLIMTNEQNISGYELKMFEYNDIKGFLPISVVRINNMITYQYRIMQSESLVKKYGSKTFSIADIKNIFSEITLLIHRAEEYLLNIDSVLLNPEYIFMNGEELLFCYFPWDGQSFGKSVRELMEYILERLDHSEQQTVMTAYGLYQKILKNNFTMDGLMEELFSDNREKENMPVVKQIETKKENAVSEKQGEIVKNNTDIFSLEKELEAELSKESKKEKRKRGLLFPWRKKENKLYGNNGAMVLAEETTYGATQLLNVKRLVSAGGGTDIILSKFPLHVGSSRAESDCVLENVMVSRKHAVITMECGGYYIEDLDSTNGTFINGSRIAPYEPVLVKEGDQISFANEKFCLN
ncbi:MAG: FHA domain-containing protein [Alistipes sp.]|nr:FHA domain-containing protein [Alistipes sp.]